MVGLGATLAIVLALANKRLHVEEDPRIDEVEEKLPGNNCGACGLPGCRAFAEKAVAGEVNPAKCTVSPPEEIDAIAALLGVEAEAEEKRVARLACAGGDNVARQRVHYQGMASCQAAALATGGGKGCVWGCLGFGDCGDVCTFEAIKMDANGLPIVDPDKCTACGDCVEICPKSLFSLQPVSRKLWVACMNGAAGDAAENECAVACTACGLCAADAAEGLITMRNNLPFIDYRKNEQASDDAIERCPTGAIVWLESRTRRVKGASAKRIVRETPLPVG
ncbi:MAG: RnfABCDGE type electron transport complex subunit B [Elusimicrobiota bacterium]